MQTRSKDDTPKKVVVKKVKKERKVPVRKTPLPNLKNKAELKKLKPLFFDADENLYYPVKVVPAYLKKMILKLRESGAEDPKHTLMAWYISLPTGSEHDVPLQESWTTLVTKTDEDDKPVDTLRVQFLKTSNGKYGENVKTGWVIMSLPNDLLLANHLISETVEEVKEVKETKE